MSPQEIAAPQVPPLTVPLWSQGQADPVEVHRCSQAQPSVQVQESPQAEPSGPKAVPVAIPGQKALPHPRQEESLPGEICQAVSFPLGVPSASVQVSFTATSQDQIQISPEDEQEVQVQIGFCGEERDQTQVRLSVGESTLSELRQSRIHNLS